MEIGKLLWNDPGFFHKMQWPSGLLWAKQLEILESIRDNKYTAVRSCNASGKSYVVSVALWWFTCACEAKGERSVVAVLAPSFSQVEKVVWREVRRLNDTAKKQFVRPSDLLTTELRFGRSLKAVGLSPESRANLLGLHEQNILVIMDEASGVCQEIDDASKSLLTNIGCKIVKIGNPYESSGHFYECFTDWADMWNCIHISAFDTPNFTKFGITLDDYKHNTWREKARHLMPCPYLVNPEWVGDRYREFGPDSAWFKCFVMGEFPDQPPDSLISLEWVNAAVQREKGVNDNKRGIGCDVARKPGGCETTIYLYDDGNFTLLDAWVGQDLMPTANKLREYFLKYQCPIGVDDTGMGGGITSRLAEQGIDVVAFVAVTKSLKHGRFADRSTEAAWAIREGLRENRFKIPNDKKLIAQLTARKIKPAADGQLKLESKEAMDDRLSTGDLSAIRFKSPDRFDGMMIAYHVARTKDKPSEIVEFDENIYPSIQDEVEVAQGRL